jgi:hypothetical protein
MIGGAAPTVSYGGRDPRDGSVRMPELKERFSRRQWNDCCGKGCKKCEIASAYIDEYGKKKGLERLNEDRDAVKKAKGKKAAGKKAAGKDGAGKKGKRKAGK